MKGGMSRGGGPCPWSQRLEPCGTQGLSRLEDGPGVPRTLCPGAAGGRSARALAAKEAWQRPDSWARGGWRAPLGEAGLREVSLGSESPGPQGQGGLIQQALRNWWQFEQGELKKNQNQNQNKAEVGPVATLSSPRLSCCPPRPSRGPRPWAAGANQPRTV